MNARNRIAAVLLASAAASAAWAADSSLHVENAWSRAMPPVSKTGAAYLTIRNTGTIDDAVVGAASGAASRTELHTNEVKNGMATMRKLESVPIPAGGTVTLEPGGLHVMLMGLARPLVAGESFELTLDLASGASLVVEVPISAAGAMAGHGRGEGQGMSDATGEAMKHDTH